MALTPDPTTQAMYGKFHHWKNPNPAEIGASAIEFLHRLPGPTHIEITGADSSRRRAVVTLSHGNEPSGLLAIYALLRDRVQPVTDMHCFIVSVDAARQPPGFAYRMLPNHKDMNRCFTSPFGDTEQDKLAQKLIDTLQSIRPEAVIDIHNTSGSGPSFGVTTFMDERHDALVSLFTHRIVVTELKLGSLMEISEAMMPTVTIECGGAQDPESHRVASDGLLRYMTLQDILSVKHNDVPLEFFHNPMRLELTERSDIAYGNHSLLNAGVTLLPHVENFNFGIVNQATQLGFVPGKLQDHLSIKGQDGRECVNEFLRLQAGMLFPAKPLKLFMVTGNPEIARKDCLFYLVEPD